MSYQTDAGGSQGGEIGKLEEGEEAPQTLTLLSGSGGGHHVAGGGGGCETVGNPEKAEGMKQTTGEMEGLERSRSTPHVEPSLEGVAGMEGGTSSGSGSSIRGDLEMTLKMEAARREEAFERRLVRKALWVGETRKLIEERRRFQESGAPTLFPELVWKQILINVEDPKDKAMMANMSLLWKELLKRERTKFLFDAVFPLLNENGMLSRDDILRFRGVCRDWKGSMETWLQNFSDHFHPPTMWEMFELEGIPTPPHSLLDLMPLKFQNGHLPLARSTGWNRLTYQPTGNPFPTRRLSLRDIWSPNEEDRRSDLFWTEAERLLTLWGREVWTVELGVCFPQSPDAVYERVCNILKLMPNLRTLVINIKMGWAAMPDEPLQDNPFLKTRMLENPLPELSHLKVMTASFLPPQMLKTMLNKFGPTLTTLTVEGSLVNRSNSYGDAKLPNLKQLSLSSWDLFTADSPFAVDWPAIEELHLSYRYDEVQEIGKLFQCLNSLGGQLRKLSIILQKKHERPIKLDGPTRRLLSLELPHLEDFSLDLSRSNLKTIDFILPLRSLKNLTVRHAKTVIYCRSGFETELDNPNYPDEGHEPEGIVKFWSCINRMYESNVWSLFPELRMVTVSIVGFLHEGIEVSTNARYRMTLITLFGNTNDSLNGFIHTREGYEKYCEGGQDS